MQNFIEIKKRNNLAMIFSSIIFLITLFNDIITRTPFEHIIIKIAIGAIGAIGAITIIYTSTTSKLAEVTKYILTITMNIFCIIEFIYSTERNNVHLVVMIFIILLVIIIFNDVILSIIQIFVGSGIISWSYLEIYKEHLRVVNSSEILLVMIYYVAAAVISIATIKFTKFIQKQNADAIHFLEIKNKKTEELLESINISIKKLNNAGNELVNTIINADKSSTLIKKSFDNMSINTEKEIDSISKIDKTVRDIMFVLEKVTSASDEMYNTSKKSLELVENGINNFRELEESIKWLKNNNLNIVESVYELEKSNKEIEYALEIIKEIAKQTNVLSLNASIESAHVGKKGEGFMVVANEIKKLADMSKESTNKIYKIINKIYENISDVQKQVDNGKKTVEESILKFKQVNVAFENITIQSKSSDKYVSQVDGMIYELNNILNGINSKITEILNVSENSSYENKKIYSQLEDYNTDINTVKEVSKNLEEILKIIKEQSKNQQVSSDDSTTIC